MHISDNFLDIHNDSINPFTLSTRREMCSPESFPWDKIDHRDCSPWTQRELTVTKMVTASRDWAVTWAVIELWPSRDWAVIAVIELWPRRDWAVT